MISIVFTYYKYVIKKDYDVFVNEDDIPTDIISTPNFSL